VLGNPSASGNKSLALENEKQPELFTCHGDESLVCCALDAHGQEVIARGTFGESSALTSSSRYALLGATVCTP
jgi:hypothetical protein